MRKLGWMIRDLVEAHEGVERIPKREFDRLAQSGKSVGKVLHFPPGHEGEGYPIYYRRRRIK